MLKEIGKEGGSQIVLGFNLTRQLLKISEEANKREGGLYNKENREGWKTAILVFEDLLVNHWTKLSEDSDFKKMQKEVHTGKIGTPYQEIEKGRRLLQGLMILAEPLLPKTEAVYETEEKIEAIKVVEE